MVAAVADAALSLILSNVDVADVAGATGVENVTGVVADVDMLVFVDVVNVVDLADAADVDVEVVHVGVAKAPISEAAFIANTAGLCC